MKLYEQFLNKVEKFLPDNDLLNERTDISALLENPQFEQLLSDSPSIVGVFNHSIMGYDFLSNNINEIFGYNTETFTCPGGMEKVLATFKLEHAQIYNQYIFPLFFEYLQKCTATKDIKKYRFTTSFQLKRSNGVYIWCMQQIKVISTDANSYPVHSLVFISDITSIKKDEDIDFVIACKDDAGVFKNVYAMTIPSAEVVMEFSRRELEILSYIKKGFSSKDIGKALFISDHTVNNHRKKIIKKANGMNIMEVIQMMSTKNMIE